MLALIVAYFFVYKFFTANNKKKLCIFALVGYIFALVCNSYYFLLEDCIYLKKVVDLYLLLFEVPRNVFFVGLPLVLLGGGLSYLNTSRENNKSVKYINFTPILFYLLYFAELAYVYGKDTRGDCSLYVFLPLFCASLVYCGIRLNISIPFDTSILRRLSTGVYFQHTFYINVLKCFGMSNIPTFICSILLSIIVCILIDHYDIKCLKRVI